MNGEIRELYTDADMARMEQRIKTMRTVLWALALGALGVCAALTARTGTLNAQRMELAVIAVSTLAGWLVIYGCIFVLTPARRELAHAVMLRSEEREEVRGALTVTGERVAIRHSITARRAEACMDDGTTRRLMVCESRAGAMAAADPAAVYVCHGYVAAYEVKTCGS